MRRVGLLQQSTRTRLMYAAVQTKYVEASPLTWLTWRWTSAASVTWLAWTLDSLVSRVLSNGPLVQSSSLAAGVVQRRLSVQILAPRARYVIDVPKQLKSPLTPGIRSLSIFFQGSPYLVTITVIERVISPLRTATNQM